MADARRSCARGPGATKQADPLPLEKAASLEYAGTKVENALAAITFGCWFLLREIELANVQVNDVKLGSGAG